ncbi:uncharacterized protein LOC124930116 [Impatiens glandulifera]|uniref:uncharacterized protein LOC124930116 n=1 Tax=Impatiens glandulifera TaxID=253017 RepID=UPI001FB122F7|nr:uncharacterized protein LOC124930116 [Impatiens glandulifera]
MARREAVGEGTTGSRTMGENQKRKLKNEANAEQWEIVDAMVRSWIMNSISSEIQENFQEIETTQELWTEIKGCYEKNNGPRRFGVKKEITNMKQGSLTLERYYSKIKLLWDESKGLKSTFYCQDEKCREDTAQNDEDDKLLQFMMGLNDRYEHIIDQILVANSSPTVYKAYTMLLNVEMKREIDENKTENFSALHIRNEENKNLDFDKSVALAVEKIMTTSQVRNNKVGTDKGKTSQNPYKNTVCKYCGLKGHMQKVVSISFAIYNGLNN